MPKTTRDNSWLLSRLDHLWTKHFNEISQDNPVVIKFGRFSKFRLGSIKLNTKTEFSIITITGMFKNPDIPEQVIDHTIGHELVHYAHGFSSPKAKLHKYPHAGGIVDKEMKDRGMGYLVAGYKEWIKEYKNLLAH